MELNKAILMKGVKSAKIAEQFIFDWLFSERPPIALASFNGFSFLGNFSLDVFTFLSVWKLSSPR